MVRIIGCPLPILWASLYLFFSSGIQSDGKDPGDREKEQFEFFQCSRIIVEPTTFRVGQ
jgi:hypothetical protein